MMRGWRSLLNVRLWLAVIAAGVTNTLAPPPSWASDFIADGDSRVAKGNQSSVSQALPTANIPRLNDSKRPPTTLKEWLSQSPPEISDSPIQITGVQLNPTSNGLEVILKTTVGEKLQPSTRSEGNTLVADIPNSQLVLPSGKNEFRADNPVAGIASVSVIQVNGNSIRVTVTGEAGVPTVELFDSPEEGLIFGIASAVASSPQGQQPQTQPTPEPGSETQPLRPSVEGEEEIELLVTGEQETEGYSVPDASTATRTDTPIRDIPQSIQVVPRQVLEDRNAATVTEAVETVSGVLDGADYFGGPSGGRTIRGFFQGGSYRNGNRDVNYEGLVGIGTIEQVEVLKGPASVVFGDIEPGGLINIITRQPLSEPYRSLAFEAGNRSLYQPSIDLSGPLTADDTLLYRFIASYRDYDSFQDFVNQDVTTIAPSITLNFGENTDLNLYYEYINFSGIPEATTTILSDDSRPPRSRFLGYPQFADINNTQQRYGYTLTHRFSENLQLRHNFAAVPYDRDEQFTAVRELIDDRFLRLSAVDREVTEDNYFSQIDLLGRFNTGSIQHQFLVGFDFNRFVEVVDFRQDNTLPFLDISNPDYDVPEAVNDFFLTSDQVVESYGIYLQDQIGLLENLKLLVGGRIDFTSRNSAFNGVEAPEQNDTAFNPRIGLVYQPSDVVSLYASYSRSFNQNFGFDVNGDSFEPSRGTQYEVGAKADLLDGRLSTTLAAYHLTKTNVETLDPDNPDFTLVTGEQRSQGIELDITGEILSGWKAIASYAYTDAEVTKDNTIPVGNRVFNVPENQVSLWTTYEIQKGDLTGLGFGLGLFYIGERQGDSDNSFTVPDYLRTDAAIYYRRNNFNAAINIRNLFNVDYISNADNGRIFLQSGAPFTITGSIGFEF